MSPGVCVPKLTGADIELGNFVEGATDRDSSVGEASRVLLAEIRSSVGASAYEPGVGGAGALDPQDLGRTFLPTNGGCAYIDLDHLELCIPEVLSAHDHVAYWHAMLEVAARAQASVNARRSPGERIQLLANNSDGRVSYGSHLNVLVSRTAWDNIVHRKPHYLAYLAAFQVSSLPITGAGKVGTEHGAGHVPYQLSQRADWFETVTGVQTTCMRPIVNTRDEPLCGRWNGASTDHARLHSIFFDSTLCHVSTFLRVGAMQLVLAMIEAGKVDGSLALDDPLTAVHQWSHDPTLRAKALLVTGYSVTALELQRRFVDQAEQFIESGYTDGIVPGAREILSLWDDTLNKLEARNWSALTGRLDWVLKLSFLQRAFEVRPELDWHSPEIKHLDQLYSSLDHTEGLYWSMAAADRITTVAAPREITRSVSEPPAGTRAWARAMLQRRAGSAVEQVDWDHVRVRLEQRETMPATWRVELPDPVRATSAELGAVFRKNGSLGELLHALRAVQEPRVSYTGYARYSGSSSPYASASWTPLLAEWQEGEIRKLRSAWTPGINPRLNGGSQDGTAGAD